jgi:hypothetical protein
LDSEGAEGKGEEMLRVVVMLDEKIHLFPHEKAKSWV